VLAESFYTTPQLFTLRPSSTASKQEIAAFGPVGISIEEGSPAETSSRSMARNWPTSIRAFNSAQSSPRVEAAPGPAFGEQLGALVESWTEGFQSPDYVRLLVSVPCKTLAPSLPTLAGLPHNAQTIPIDQWTDGSAVIEAVVGE